MSNDLINKEQINKLIKEHISASIVTSLGGVDNFVSQVVQLTLDTKVNEHGKKDTYNCNYTFLEYTLMSLIRVSVEEALRELLVQSTPGLKEQVKKAFEKHSDILTENFVKGLNQSIKCGFSTKITVNFKEDYKESEE